MRVRISPTAMWLVGVVCCVVSSQAAVAEEGAAVEQDSRALVERAWFDAEPTAETRAAAIENSVLMLGDVNAESASRSLLTPDRSLTSAELELALALAPNLPLAHMATARHLWSQGDREEALAAVGQAALAVPRHFEATALFASSALVMSIFALVLASAGLVVGIAISNFGRAAHDLGDLVSTNAPSFARAAALGSVLLLPWVLGEGVAGVLLVLFGIGIVYGGARHRAALVFASVLLLAALQPLATLTGRVLGMLGSDPVVESIWAVTRDVAGPADLARLEAVRPNDALAAQALAIEARRHGRTEEALQRYTQILAVHPDNPEILNNLANLHFAAGDVPRAIDLYQSASAATESARVWFNLSQAYAERSGWKSSSGRCRLHKAWITPPSRGSPRERIRSSRSIWRWIRAAFSSAVSRGLTERGSQAKCWGRSLRAGWGAACRCWQPPSAPFSFSG